MIFVASLDLPDPQVPLFDEELFLHDCIWPANLAQAQAWMSVIVGFMARSGGKADAQQLYLNLDIWDVALQLALHLLLREGVIVGTEPYGFDTPFLHSRWQYRLKELAQ